MPFTHDDKKARANCARRPVKQDTSTNRRADLTNPGHSAREQKSISGKGVSGSRDPMPHKKQIQKSFGHRDISSAKVDGPMQNDRVPDMKNAMLGGKPDLKSRDEVKQQQGNVDAKRPPNYDLEIPAGLQKEINDWFADVAEEKPDELGDAEQLIDDCIDDAKSAALAVFRKAGPRQTWSKETETEVAFAIMAAMGPHLAEMNSIHHPGCHLASKLVAYVATCFDVKAESRSMSEFQGDEHAIAYFSDLDLGTFHADDIYTSGLTPEEYSASMDSIDAYYEDKQETLIKVSLEDATAQVEAIRASGSFTAETVQELIGSGKIPDIPLTVPGEPDGIKYTDGKEYHYHAGISLHEVLQSAHFDASYISLISFEEVATSRSLRPNDLTSAFNVSYRACGNEFSCPTDRDSVLRLMAEEIGKRLLAAQAYTMRGAGDGKYDDIKKEIDKKHYGVHKRQTKHDH